MNTCLEIDVLGTLPQKKIIIYIQTFQSLNASNASVRLLGVMSARL